jgi:hypothetical protein
VIDQIVTEMMSNPTKLCSSLRSSVVAEEMKLAGLRMSHNILGQSLVLVATLKE